MKTVKNNFMLKSLYLTRHSLFQRILEVDGEQRGFPIQSQNNVSSLITRKEFWKHFVGSGVTQGSTEQDEVFQSSLANCSRLVYDRG